MAVDRPDQTTPIRSERAVNPPARGPASSSAVAELYQDLPAIAAILDERGIILALSKEAEVKFGANARLLIGRSVMSLAHRDDRANVVEAIQSALEKRDQIAHCEFRIWRGAKPALRLRTSIRAATVSGPATLLAVASDMTDEALLERQLTQRSSELGEMANRLVIAQHEERRKIAADMHDTVGHSLALAKFHVDGLRAHELSDDGRKAVDGAAKTLQDAIDAVRSLTFTLNSTPLHDHGLDAAIEELGQSLSLTNDLQFSLSSRPRPKRLSQTSRILLYRIVRELLVNVAKHAKASRVRVSIGLIGTDLHIAVVDDGVGIGRQNLESHKGTGLRSTRSRVAALGGSMSIEPHDDRGTRVWITVPFVSVGEPE